MATVMTTYGDFGSAFPPVVGRISLTNEVAAPNETVLITDGPVADPTRFAAILIGRESIAPPRGTVGRFDNLDHLKDGDIVLIDGKSGRTRTLYRANSFHNSLYVTDLCDNRCIMCSQPPHERDDGGPLAVAMRTVALLKSAPPTRLGITGGEPTMLGDGLIRLLTAMATDLPETTVTCLSNPAVQDKCGEGWLSELEHGKPLFGRWISCTSARPRRWACAGYPLHFSSLPLSGCRTLGAGL